MSSEVLGHFPDTIARDLYHTPEKWTLQFPLFKRGNWGSGRFFSNTTNMLTDTCPRYEVSENILHREEKLHRSLNGEEKRDSWVSYGMLSSLQLFSLSSLILSTLLIVFALFQNSVSWKKPHSNVKDSRPHSVQMNVWGRSQRCILEQMHLSFSEMPSALLIACTCVCSLTSPLNQMSTWGCPP